MADWVKGDKIPKWLRKRAKELLPESSREERYAFAVGWMSAAARVDALAYARAQYLTPTPRGRFPYLDESNTTIEKETRTARNLARMLRDPQTAWGWLPSWLWHIFDIKEP